MSLEGLGSFDNYIGGFFGESYLQKGSFGAAQEKVSEIASRRFSLSMDESRRLFIGCPHNDRGETTAADVLEHAGNFEFGSAARDVYESPAGQAVVDAVIETARDVAQTVGDGMMKD